MSGCAPGWLRGAVGAPLRSEDCFPAVGLGVVPLDDSGGGEAGPRFDGLPAHLGGPRFTPPAWRLFGGPY